MGNMRGNPAWVKGKSGNLRGRPRGQNSITALCRDPTLFLWIKHYRWEQFCFYLMDPPYTKTAAARKAGYSPKSARFIASRLWRKPIIREIFKRVNDRVNATVKMSDDTWMIPDYSGHYHIAYRKIDKSQHF